MKKRLITFAVGISAAMFALPAAAASAGVWHAEPSTAATPLTTTTLNHGNIVKTTANRTTTCSASPSSTGTGSIDTGGTTGKITLTLFGCSSLGTPCTTPGQASGVIKTSENLVTHNILLEAGLPGFKITGVGASTQLMHYTCGFGLVTVNVTGTVIGEVEKKCGEKTTNLPINFEAPGGSQKWKQETTTGTSTDLIFTINGTPETAGLTGTMTTSTGAATREIKCT